MPSYRNKTKIVKDSYTVGQYKRTKLNMVNKIQ